jgi:hypothetical protein
MSSASTLHLLADGALLQNGPLAQRLDPGGRGRALYEDLGDSAARLGPWLLPWPDDLDLSLVPLPSRYGLSQLQVEVAPDALHQHLRGLRHVSTDDGQRFFLRLADTRALAAMAQAWPADLLAALKGPVQAWRWCDREGQWWNWVPGIRGASRAMRPLTLSEFEALVAAGEADRLAAELEGLGEPDLKPMHDPHQHRLVSRAAAWLTAQAPLPWAWRWTVAWQAVRTGGRALDHPGFEQCLAQARTAGDLSRLRAWRPASAESDGVQA